MGQPVSPHAARGSSVLGGERGGLGLNSSSAACVGRAWAPCGASTPSVLSSQTGKSRKALCLGGMDTRSRCGRHGLEWQCAWQPSAGRLPGLTGQEVGPPSARWTQTPTCLPTLSVRPSWFRYLHKHLFFQTTVFATVFLLSRSCRQSPFWDRGEGGLAHTLSLVLLCSLQRPHFRQIVLLVFTLCAWAPGPPRRCSHVMCPPCSQPSAC